ncbi:thiamine biosynthesis protein ThiF [Sulfurimonas sp.]|uniref:thiamine biosynthesis protein ThiF n=1 Tax=Sulfurimonas sp. TaxID=2022749 RepID=UPI0025F9266A|nr:thiamine biosynthesis protein ThiF [Sulfurimonas sp.]
MSHGFDLNSPLICEGIIGDGCGGGRLFMVVENTLKAYDPTTKNSRVLLENINKSISISKKACIVTVVCEDETIEFDLSEMKKV